MQGKRKPNGYKENKFNGFPYIFSFDLNDSCPNLSFQVIVKENEKEGV
ncbi:hypothetical protein EfmJHP35_18610 [Enterococcus faecium]|nr:hypothetical protein EfmJHP35_18610 [Enterococcus faecium]